MDKAIRSSDPELAEYLKDLASSYRDSEEFKSEMDSKWKQQIKETKEGLWDIEPKKDPYLVEWKEFISLKKYLDKINKKYNKKCTVDMSKFPNIPMSAL